MAKCRYVHRTVALSVAAAFLLVLTLVGVGGCGGDETKSPEGSLTVAEIAPELASFGELAGIEAPPVTVSFDSDGGQLDLDDGAMIVVPAGAFEEEISLTVTIVGLALEYFDPRVGPARAYAIESDRDLPPLAEPVTLEIPFPTEISGVATFEDGEWVKVDVPPGGETRIEIYHFSTKAVIFIPAAIEYVAELGWEASREIGLTIPQVHLTLEAERVLKEQEHHKWVTTEADQLTRDFYGLDEDGKYVHPTHTQEEMCAELQALVSRYSDFSLPADFSPYRLIRHLFNAGDPKPENEAARQEAWPEFWDLTSGSMEVIDQQVLAASTPLTPAQVLDIAIDANQGNVPLGLLAAHNYLKHIAYSGRSYADPPPDGLQEPVLADIGAPTSHLESWRQETPANPAGRLDKMGPLYHIFAAAVAGVWFPRQADTPEFGDIAVGGEAFMRSFIGILAGDVPDREKGWADECGARLADTVRTAAAAAAADAGVDDGGGADGEPAGEEAEPSSPAEEGKAWVFEGTGLFRHMVDTEEAEVCEDLACPYVLTLFPDGRAELHVTRGFGWVSLECVERDGNIYVGTWQDGSFKILGQFEAGGPVVDPSFLVSGTYTSDLAKGKGGYDNDAGFSAVFDFETQGLKRKTD